MTKKEFIALYAERANFETKVDAEKKLDTVLNLFEEILTHIVKLIATFLPNELQMVSSSLSTFLALN